MHFTPLLTIAISILVGVNAGNVRRFPARKGSLPIGQAIPATQPQPSSHLPPIGQAIPATQPQPSSHLPPIGQAIPATQPQRPAQQQPGQVYLPPIGQAIPAPQPSPAYQQRPAQQQPGQGYQPIPVQQFPGTDHRTIIASTTVTVSNFETVTHYLQVTQTRDVRVTETLNTNLVFTQEVTVRQAEPGRPNTATAVVNAYQPLLVVETVQTGVNTGKVATATATHFVTTTENSPCTETITHYDRVLEQIVVPVQTVVYVDQVTTLTINVTVTQEVTITLTPPTSPSRNSRYT